MHSRDLCSREIEAYGFFIGWFEQWRMRQSLKVNRCNARRFWKEVVVVKQRERWQLDQWAVAVRMG